MRAFITGIAGFAGSHLADYLATYRDIEISGACLPNESTRNLTALLKLITLYPVDLNDYRRVVELLAKAQPDYIFHLAAQASVERSWTHPAETLVNNITIQLNLLQAVIELGLKPRLLIIGSADEYGQVRPEDLPIAETAPLRPLNPYAVSKLTQDFLGYQYYLSHGLHIVRVRPFNHVGPRQGTGFVVPDFARQVARIELGLQEPVLRVGSLSAYRDFSDVRDIVRGYYYALYRGKPGEVYNLGSAHAHSIQEILERLLQLSTVQVRVEQDPQRMRPSDTPLFVCDNRRFREDTGWQPEYHLNTTLQDVLDYWRKRVREEQ